MALDAGGNWVGIRAYCGLPGSGKTLGLVERVLVWSKSKRPLVLIDVPIKPAAVRLLRRRAPDVRIYTGQAFIAMLEEWGDLPEPKTDAEKEQHAEALAAFIPRGSLIAWDEVQTVAGQKYDHPGLMRWTSMIRHARQGLIWCTQDPMLVTLALRRMTETFREHEGPAQWNWRGLPAIFIPGRPHRATDFPRWPKRVREGLPGGIRYMWTPRAIMTRRMYESFTRAGADGKVQHESGAQYRRTWKHLAKLVVLTIVLGIWILTVERWGMQAAFRNIRDRINPPPPPVQLVAESPDDKPLREQPSFPDVISVAGRVRNATTGEVQRPWEGFAFHAGSSSSVLAVRSLQGVPLELWWKPDQTNPPRWIPVPLGERQLPTLTDPESFVP